jgi:tetratricopeptide (TPR) repeat protein
MLSQADKNLKEKKFRDAKKLYKLLLDKGDDSALAYLGLSTCAYHLKEYKDAEIYALKVLEIQPDLYKPHLILAYVHARRGNLANSEMEIRKALEISPASPDILSFGGGVLVAQEKINEGYSMLQKAKEIDPSDWIVYYNLGLSYLKEKNYKKALREYLISFNIRRSFSTLERILLIYAYLYRVFIITIHVILTLLAFYMRSIILLLIPTVPIITIGILARKDKGLLLVLTGSIPIILFYLTK